MRIFETRELFLLENLDKIQSRRSVAIRFVLSNYCKVFVSAQTNVPSVPQGSALSTRLVLYIFRSVQN
jgi:hypothetical protein